MKVLAWYIDPNGIKTANTFIYPYPSGIKKCETLVIDPQIESKQDDTKPPTGTV